MQKEGQRRQHGTEKEQQQTQQQQKHTASRQRQSVATDGTAADAATTEAHSFMPMIEQDHKDDSEETTVSP